MATKRGSLAGFSSKKTSAPAQTQPQEQKPQPQEEGNNRKGQTLRLSPEAWKQLKFMAFDSGHTAHTLLVEAVNDLFKKYGKPPIA